MNDAGDGPEAKTRREAPSSRRSEPPPDKPRSTPFGSVGDRFELGEELGRGGMGRVVAATDRSLAREVAIKQVLADDDVLLARFEREVRITAKLEHPAIVPLHDAGRDRNGRPYYVMRRLRGDQLSDRVAKLATARDRLALVPSVLAAVDAAAFAHSRGIIHRDIKPWNILIGDFGETVLIDWGLARELDEAEDTPVRDDRPSGDNLTRAGHVFGTPGYMAPEQARGEPADPRSDVFALGATLQHVLTGSTALQGSSATEWIERAQQGTLESAAMPAEVPRELVAIVEKAMAADPAARYAHAGELAQDLRAFLAGQLVAAHHYTMREMIARFLRKHRIAIAIAAVAAIAFAVFATISVRNIVAERDRADEERANAVRERAIADDLAEVRLLDRASTLARTDPTRTVALLRRIPLTSPHLPRARDIAAGAAAGGIEHGLMTNMGAAFVLKFSPDGRLLVAAGEREGVHVIDPATASVNRLALPGRRSHVGVFVDNDRLVVDTQDPRALHLVNVRTGDVRTLAPLEVDQIWRMDDDRIRYFAYKHQTVGDLSLSTGQITSVASGVTTAMQLGSDRLIIGDRTSMRLLAGERTIELAKESNGFIVPSADGSRFAIAYPRRIIEFDREGVELGRWDRDLAVAFYRDNMLYGSQRDGTVQRLVTGGVPATYRLAPNQYIAATSKRFATLHAMTSGKVILLDSHGIHELPREEPETINVVTDDRWLAKTTRSGMVTWFELRHVVPDEITIEPGAPCWATPSHFYVTSSTGVVEYERATGRKTKTISFMPPTSIECEGVIDGKLIANVDRELRIADLETGKPLRFGSEGHVDLAAKRAVLARDRDLLEITLPSGAQKLLTTLPAKLQYWATAGRWAFAATATAVYRYDRETGATATLASTFDAQAPSPDGTFVFVRDKTLYRWDGTTTRALHALPSTKAKPMALANRQGAVSLYYDDNSLWFATDLAILNRAGPLGSPRGVMGGFAQRHQVVRFSPERIMRHYLATGETTTYAVPTIFARIFETGSLVVTSFDRLTVFDELVPADPKELHRWIDRATNAAIDDRTDAVTWREGVGGR